MTASYSSIESTQTFWEGKISQTFSKTFISKLWNKNSPSPKFDSIYRDRRLRYTRKYTFGFILLTIYSNSYEFSANIISKVISHPLHNIPANPNLTLHALTHLLWYTASSSKYIGHNYYASRVTIELVAKLIKKYN